MREILSFISFPSTISEFFYKSNLFQIHTDLQIFGHFTKEDAFVNFGFFNKQSTSCTLHWSIASVIRDISEITRIFRFNYSAAWNSGLILTPYHTRFSFGLPSRCFSDIAVPKSVELTFVPGFSTLIQSLKILNNSECLTR